VNAGDSVVVRAGDRAGARGIAVRQLAGSDSWEISLEDGNNIRATGDRLIHEADARNAAQEFASSFVTSFVQLDPRDRQVLRDRVMEQRVSAILDEARKETENDMADPDDLDEGVTKDAMEYMLKFGNILYPILPDVVADGFELAVPEPLSAFEAEARVRALASYMHNTTRPSGRLAGDDEDQ
jgi:hypothetical protein